MRKEGGLGENGRARKNNTRSRTCNVGLVRTFCFIMKEKMFNSQREIPKYELQRHIPLKKRVMYKLTRETQKEHTLAHLYGFRS